MLRHSKKSHARTSHLGVSLNPSAWAKRALEKKVAAGDKLAKELLGALAKERAEKDALHAATVREVVEFHAKREGLDDLDTKKLCNRVENARQRHIAAGGAHQFNPYRELRNILTANGQAAQIARSSGVLPPPKPEARRAPPGARPTKEAAQAAYEAQQREERKRAAVDLDNHEAREDYSARLKRLGLQDPSLPTMGTGKGLAG